MLTFSHQMVVDRGEAFRFMTSMRFQKRSVTTYVHTYVGDDDIQPTRKKHRRFSKYPIFMILIRTTSTNSIFVTKISSFASHLVCFKFESVVIGYNDRYTHGYKLESVA